MMDNQTLESYLAEVEAFSEQTADNLRSAFRQCEDDIEWKLGRIRSLETKVERLEAEAAAMRRALEETKAYLLADVRTWNPLPKIEAALAADIGRVPLERLRRAERERDEALAGLKAVHQTQLAILRMGGADKA